jgi:exodeoxyribonuclease V beta subunit
MSSGEALAFDLCGPLPEPGVTVLEASAGTGKTYTIAALVARYVAQGVPLSEIMAVTFTRMATGELRDRVRERLVTAHRHLDRLLTEGVAVPAEDEVAGLLAGGSTEQVALRCRLLAEAASSFDEATITTTHGFCQLVLSSMGVSGGASSADGLLEDTSELIDQVVDDLFLERALRYGEPAFSIDRALAVARKAIQNLDTPLEPPSDDSVAGRLRRFAELVRREFQRRLRQAELLTYDDLLLRLRNALLDPERGKVACERLGGRYQVVLVDEFQDTDPVQWQVVSSAFGDGRAVLVLIGDPKQAIYAFRGADVYAYLSASRQAQHHFTLGENYRSDRDLLHALDALLDPLLLGHPDIPYRRVKATVTHQRPGLEGAPVEAAMRVRVLADDQPGVQRTTKGKLQKRAAVQWVAEDLAADVAALLCSGAQLVERGTMGEERSRSPVAASDVAVLVRTNDQASVVHEALRAVGVPSVVASSASIFSTRAAQDWMALLEAIEQPASRPRLAAAALGPFVGWQTEELAAATDARLEDLSLRFYRLGEVLRRSGIATAYRAALAEGAVPGRLLGQPDGERRMTDLGHVAELLGAEAAVSRSGPARLRAWLARRIAEAGEDESEERIRRLDSDAEAVQVLTVHRSKGLEFPVVYCPYLWDAGSSRPGQPVVFHDPSAEFRRTLDVGPGDGPYTASYIDHARLCHEEERGEQLRHLYVAATRAKNQVVFWWARVHECQRSPLGRLLFSRDEEGNVDPDGGSKEPRLSEVTSRLRDVSDRARGAFVVESATGPTEVVHSGGRIEVKELAAASFTRQIDVTWRRSSYSAITAAAHEDLVSSEPETTGIVDEPAARAEAHGAGATGERPAQGPLASACPLGAMPAGAEVGTVVHKVLERVDFTASDVHSELAEALRVEEARHGAVVGEQGLVASGLAAALRTPLGPLLAGARLCDVSPADRLDELAFEFPVAGGDRSPGSVAIADLAGVLDRHVPPGDLLDGYASRLVDPALQPQLRGYLTGSIDLVLRRPAGDEPRYFVVDYKTNRLAPREETLQAWHYRPEALDIEMQRLHYPLQALIYAVALHRYLRWRMAGYDPDRHLGGVLYLFLRGMLGPDTPTVEDRPCGVFAWRPPSGLVEALSDVLAGGGDTQGEGAS